jgi:hypothetical protein
VRLARHRASRCTTARISRVSGPLSSLQVRVRDTAGVAFLGAVKI